MNWGACNGSPWEVSKNTQQSHTCLWVLGSKTHQLCELWKLHTYQLSRQQFRCFFEEKLKEVWGKQGKGKSFKQNCVEERCAASTATQVAYLEPGAYMGIFSPMFSTCMFINKVIFLQRVHILHLQFFLPSKETESDSSCPWNTSLLSGNIYTYITLMWDSFVCLLVFLHGRKIVSWCAWPRMEECVQTWLLATIQQKMEASQQAKQCTEQQMEAVLRNREMRDLDQKLQVTSALEANYRAADKEDPWGGWTVC